MSSGSFDRGGEDSKDGSSFPDPAMPLMEKSRSAWRWVILVLGCLMMLGSYYCFDIPAALKTQLDDYMGNPSDYEIKFGLMYTLYAAPNVIIPFFGGMLVDRVGVRFSLLLFASLITLGQAIFSLGVSTKSWPIIFMGRLIFGFGGESFTVANSALLADWFKGKELALAFGINLSISKLGSVINNVLSPALTNSAGIVFAIWFGTIICGACVGCVLLTIPIDKGMEMRIASSGGGYTVVSAVDKDTGAGAGADAADGVEDDSGKQRLSASKVAGGEKDDALSDEDGSDASGSSAAANAAPKVQFRDILTFRHIFWVLVLSTLVVYGAVLPFNNISSALLLERDYFKEPPSGCHLQDKTECESNNNPAKNCPASKWYQPPLPHDVEVDGHYYKDELTSEDIDCTDDAWSDGCTKEYCDRLTEAQTQTSFIMSIPYIISAILSPPLGYFIDRFGFRAVIAMLAPMILIVVHFLLAFTDVSPVGPLIGQGLAYTGYVSVLWPSYPLVVEERLTGLAFGMATSMQNLSCAIIPLIVAAIYDSSGDKYIPNVEIMFATLGIVGALVGVYMNIYDVTHGSVLNKPDSSAADAAFAASNGGDGGWDDDADESGTVSSPMYKGGSAATMGDPLLLGSGGTIEGGDGGDGDDGGGDDCGGEGAVWTERTSRAASTEHGTHSRSHSKDHNHHGPRQRSRSQSQSQSRGRRGTSFSAYEEVFKGGVFHHDSNPDHPH